MRKKKGESVAGTALGEAAWLGASFPEPVSGLGIKGPHSSHSFLIGTELYGAGWPCCLARLSGG